MTPTISSKNYFKCIPCKVDEQSHIGYRPFLPKKNTIFLHTCAACSELPSNTSTMDPDPVNLSPDPQLWLQDFMSKICIVYKKEGVGEKRA